MDELKKVELATNQTYKPSGPFKARIISSTALANGNTDDEVRHITIDLTGSGLDYTEGQSLGVVPPFMNAKGKREKVRLYSIASSRNGDSGNGESVSICVKRLVYENEEGQKVRGVCSNYLCDLKAGDELDVTGPTGRHFFLPANKDVDLILIATGTGVAPFRAYLDHIYRDLGGWDASISMFFGVKYARELLYSNDENKDLNRFVEKPEFNLFTALSRESFTETGQKVYVQHILDKERETILPILNRGNFSVYICGLKGMETGIEEVFTSWLEPLGKEWKEVKKSWRKNGRWNVEVY